MIMASVMALILFGNTSEIRVYPKKEELPNADVKIRRYGSGDE